MLKTGLLCFWSLQWKSVAAGWESAQSSGSDKRTCRVPGLLLSGQRGSGPHYSPLPHSWTASSLTSLLNSICQRKGSIHREQKQNMMGTQRYGCTRFFNFEGQAGEQGLMGNSTAGTLASSQRDLDTSQYVSQCVSWSVLTYRCKVIKHAGRFLCNVEPKWTGRLLVTWLYSKMMQNWIESSGFFISFQLHNSDSESEPCFGVFCLFRSIEKCCSVLSFRSLKSTTSVLQFFGS